MGEGMAAIFIVMTLILIAIKLMSRKSPKDKT